MSSSQIFRPRANTIARVVVYGSLPLLLVIIGIVIVLVRTPWFTGEGRMPRQPVPFSHEHHVGGLGIDCRYCHTSVEVSPFAGIPVTETCMSCHSQLWTHAEMLAPVRESYRTGTPIAWTRVHDVPDFAYFNHSIHIDRGVACVSCHGRVERMPLTRQTENLLMQWCLECHRERATPTGGGALPRLIECSICHR